MKAIQEEAAATTATTPETLYKCSHLVNEIQITFDYLQEHTASATMTTVATGIPQKHLTRYKRRLQKMGLLWIVAIQKCKVTGRYVQYLTTNPQAIPKQSSQLTLF